LPHCAGFTLFFSPDNRSGKAEHENDKIATGPATGGENASQSLHCHTLQLLKTTKNPPNKLLKPRNVRGHIQTASFLSQRGNQAHLTPIRQFRKIPVEIEFYRQTNQ
jgi:hypothetical protein